MFGRCHDITSLNGFASSMDSSRCQMASVGQWPWLNNAAPSLQPHYRTFDTNTTTDCSAPAPRFGTLALAVGAACGLSLHARRRDEAQVLTFHTKAWSSFKPPTCRMPLGQASGFSRADPGGRDTPRFRHRLIRFRHFIDGSLALASLNLACRDHVPTFPQRSPPSLLTTAACGGLRSTPDCRPRRALLHLSYSCAWPFGPAMLVTQDPFRTLIPRSDLTVNVNNVAIKPALSLMGWAGFIKSGSTAVTYGDLARDKT